jgi:hypothetical protein
MSSLKYSRQATISNTVFWDMSCSLVHVYVPTYFSVKMQGIRFSEKWQDVYQITRR